MNTFKHAIKITSQNGRKIAIALIATVLITVMASRPILSCIALLGVTFGWA